MSHAGKMRPDVLVIAREYQNRARILNLRTGEISGYLQLGCVSA
jgi:hypothetical protein